MFIFSDYSACGNLACVSRMKICNFSYRVKNKWFPKCSINFDVLTQIGFQNVCAIVAVFLGEKCYSYPILSLCSLILTSVQRGKKPLLIYLCYKNAAKHILNVYCLFQWELLCNIIIQIYLLPVVSSFCWTQTLQAFSQIIACVNCWSANCFYKPQFIDKRPFFRVFWIHSETGFCSFNSPISWCLINYGWG